MGKNKSNPLASARGKQKRPENIWFRRSGAGFQLFVEYYAGQPAGTVVLAEEESRIKKHARNDVAQGAGLSRATKRRKKKKRQQQCHDSNEVNTSTLPVFSSTTTAAATVASTATALDPHHPLLQAMNDQKAHHLRPFLESMSKPLPLTFRLRHGSDAALREAARKRLQDDFGDIVEPLALDIYQATCLSKATLATESPQLKDFLMQQSQNGVLARQELGSMLPVLLLSQAGLLKSSRVLDLCASPGSKTLQVLERLGSKGKIVANDVSETRLTALQKAVQRSGVPSRRLQYTCQDARQYQVANNKDKDWNVILCDVPCSGDGTCRKDKHVLPMWKPNCGNQLHTTQLDILVRAIELLSDGGVVCYSTCSLNPVEDEAVVAAALQRSSVRAELLPCPKLPGLLCRPGIPTWRVADYPSRSNETNDNEQDDDRVHVVWHESYQDAVQTKMEKPCKSMWPPSEKQAKELHLDHCIRLWPQDQDSGGFFLALIRKLPM